MPIKQPLADLMRPKQLKDLVGQEELVNEGAPLYQIIHKHVPVSFLLWGPPGTGKTSLAHIIAREYNYPLANFNASVDNKLKLTQIINTYPHQSFVLLIDEIHRMTKNIQDYLLPYLESGQVMLIGVTTENPIVSIVPAVRSRCQIFEFKALSDQNILTVLKKATTDVLKIEKDKIDSEAFKMIATSADGDLRVALNILETVHAINGDKLSIDAVKDFVKKQHFAYDKKATKHYDYLAAYSDSMVGSDTDAALYYY